MSIRGVVILRLLVLLAALPVTGSGAAAAAQLAPALTVVGTTAAGLAIPSSGAALASGITVATGAEPAEDVVATVTPLLDSGTGQRYEVEAPTTSLGTLPANTTAFIPLDAALPSTGTFTATLSLAHDRISDPPVPITVTRSVAPSGVTVDAVQISASTFTGLSGTTTVTRSLVLNETAGRHATLGDPVLVKPSSQTGGALQGESAATVTGTTVPATQAGCSSEEGLIHIDAGRSCLVEVSLALPRSPGQYEGTLRFSQPGAAPLDSAITVQLRRGLLLATLVILLGLGLGYLINVVLRTRRTRLDRLARVARTGAELDRLAGGLTGGLQDDTERRTHVALRAQLASIAAEGEDGAEVDGHLLAIRLQVAAFVPWVNLRRAVLAAPDEIREPLLADVDAIGASLVAAGTTQDEAKALPDKTQQIASRLRTRQSAMVRNQITRTQADVAAWFAQDVRTPIDAQLERALAFVATDDGSPELALRELSAAEALAVTAMGERLEDLLEVPSPSLGMDQASWTQLQAQVRETLSGASGKDPRAALGAVREADRTIVRTLANAAHTAISTQSKALSASVSPADKERRAALDVILGRLDATRSALALGDLAAAHAALDAAHVGIREANTRSFLGRTGQDATVLDLTPAPAQPLPAMAPAPDLTVPTLPDAAEVANQRRNYDWLLLAATLVIGVAVGLLALYVGKPTWGSLGDVLMAILWGAGLYQATGAIQQGFAGVRTGLTG